MKEMVNLKYKTQLAKKTGDYDSQRSYSTRLDRQKAIDKTARGILSRSMYPYSPSCNRYFCSQNADYLMYLPLLGCHNNNRIIKNLHGYVTIVVPFLIFWDDTLNHGDYEVQCKLETFLIEYILSNTLPAVFVYLLIHGGLYLALSKLGGISIRHMVLFYSLATTYLQTF